MLVLCNISLILASLILALLNTIKIVLFKLIVSLFRESHIYLHVLKYCSYQYQVQQHYLHGK